MISPVAGKLAAPASTCSPSTTATSDPQNGTPRTNDFVPSMGSITQRRPLVPARSPNSSPRTPSDGKRARDPPARRLLGSSVSHSHRRAVALPFDRDIRAIMRERHGPGEFRALLRPLAATTGRFGRVMRPSGLGCSLRASHASTRTTVATPSCRMPATSAASAPAPRDHVAEVRRAARPAARDDRHGDGLRHGPRQLQVVAGAGAITVDAREEDLARAPRDALARPLDRVEFRAHACAGRVHTPGITFAPGVDARDDALRPKRSRPLGQDRRAVAPPRN